MPLFHYLATDKAGRAVEGTINADSENLAATTLSQRGYYVNRVVASLATSAPIAAAGVQKISPVAGVQPQVFRQPVASKTTDPIKTKKTSDAEMYFICTQLAGFLRAGIGPQQALRDMAARTRRDDIRESLEVASQRAGEGGKVSDALERYPYLYPPHMIGLIRAGETGGFLPDAVAMMAEQADTSRKVNALAKWLYIITVTTAICLPPMSILLQAAVRIWELQDKAGGTIPPMTALGQAFSEKLVWPVGPIAAVAFLVWYLAAKWWLSMPNRLRRHRALLKVQGFKQRTREESLTYFAWALSLLSKSGVPPGTAWGIAVQCMPNLELRRDLENLGANMRENTKLSDVMYRSKSLPEEYGPVVETGEITGDVPGALMRASQSSQSTFKTSDQMAKGRIGCWLLLVMVVGAGIAAMMVANYYRVIIPTVLGD